MTDDNFDLSRRKALAGLGTIGVASAGAGAGTFAYFSDTEESTGNTIGAGTLDLELGGGDGSPGDGASGTLTAANIAPGETVSGTIEAQNAGSVAADHVEVKFRASGTEAEAGGSDGADLKPDSGAGMDRVFEVTQLRYSGSGGTDLLSEVGDANGNGIVDLDDVASHGVFDDLTPAPGPGETENLDVELRFVSTGTHGSYTGPLDDDRFQGDELSITVDMALAQDASQDLLSESPEFEVETFDVSGSYDGPPYEATATVRDAHGGLYLLEKVAIRFEDSGGGLVYYEENEPDSPQESITLDAVLGSGNHPGDPEPATVRLFALGEGDDQRTQLRSVDLTEPIGSADKFHVAQFDVEGAGNGELDVTATVEDDDGDDDVGFVAVEAQDADGNYNDLESSDPSTGQSSVTVDATLDGSGINGETSNVELRAHDVDKPAGAPTHVLDTFDL